MYGATDFLWLLNSQFILGIRNISIEMASADETDFR